MLTEAEHELVDKLGECMGMFSRIVGQDEKTRGADLTEACHHIHVLQNMVLAQSAAREYPDNYRLMGRVIE